MSGATVSVIVVSRGRPEALALCLEALRRQNHPQFEVIVVADAAGIAAAGDLVLKRVPFELANISAARNAGLAVAAGAVVAFIDDDAVAEPGWLTRLVAPFEQPEVAAAGGFVRGRNGISFQWQARAVDCWGSHRDLPTQAVHLAPPPGEAIRTEGTNCAFRRAVLAEIGGFDAAYKFYLDETDVNMRMAARGLITAIVPGAVVQHGFAPGPYRRADRVPVSLHEIGASSAVFWRRHAAGRDTAKADARLRAEQHERLAGMMALGKLGPREIGLLMASLEAGLAEGKARNLARLEPLLAGTEPFLPYPALCGPTRLITGRIWQAKRLRTEAARAAAEGGDVMLILLSPTARPHRVRFCKGGYWEQRGGLYGRSDRSDRAFRFWRFNRRIAREKTRLGWRDVAD